MKEEDCRLCQYYTQQRCTHADFSIEGLMGARPRPPAAHPAHPPPLPPELWMTNDALWLSTYFLKLGYYQPAGPLITAAPLHGGFKDGGPPPTLAADQASQFGRYPYAQPQQVMHYGAGFGTQYGPHAHYGPGDLCYGAGRGPGGPVPPAPCYRPQAAHRATASYRHAGGPGSVGVPTTGPHDSQISPAAPEPYPPQYCPPCYQHPHAPPRAPIAFIDPGYQGPCPCPIQSCPKNVHTGPATGNPSTGAGPIASSPPGGSRAPAPILAPPIINYCIEDKRKAKTSNGKDPPLLNQVLKNECSLKNNSELISGMCQILDSGALISGRSPKREYFPEQATSRSRQEVGDNRGGCCAVAINPSLSVIPPEAHGPPSPARGSAGATIPQPPDPPHPRLTQQPSPLLSHSATPNVIPQRRARVGKAMVRKSIGVDDNPGQTTMLLMCQPQAIPIEMQASKVLSSPLKIITEPIQSNVDEVKSELVDSGDEVILLDSPNSKMAPIDLSSSEENISDSKSDKDCVIISPNEHKNETHSSSETKKENTCNSGITPKKNGSFSSDMQMLKERSIDLNISNDTCLKNVNDIKSKVGTKRRCSQPKLEIDLDLQIDDSLSTNGIGEHVKLQKRQKVTINNQISKKNAINGSYKSLIKKTERVFRLNNGKRQLTMNRAEKVKHLSKGMCLIDSDKLRQKKLSNKRKSTSPSAIDLPSVNKRKKIAHSLLKYTDKKQQTRHYNEIIDKTPENHKKGPPQFIQKNKSDILLENLIMKNNIIDPVIENVDKAISIDVDNNSESCKTTAKVLQNSCLKKLKKCSDLSNNACTVKNRTVLNINNNVVKKINESDCNRVSLLNVESKVATEKQTRNKSKSPASLNRKTDKNLLKDASVAKLKCQNSDSTVNTKVTKGEKAKRQPKSKALTAVKSVKRKSKVVEVNENESVELIPVRRPSAPRWSNGWTWEGEPQQGKVYINNEDTWLLALCYPGMRHARAGDSVKRGDCVLLRSGSRRTEAPFVARVTQLWENPSDGEMMVSLLWYYRPEHTEAGRQPDDCADEVFASRHRDANSVACIEDKCYVLSFNEYCRYRKLVKATEENIVGSTSIVPSMPPSEITPAVATNDGKVPINISPDLVLFCRRIYDFRLKKIVKPPN